MHKQWMAMLGVVLCASAAQAAPKLALEPVFAQDASWLVGQRAIEQFTAPTPEQAAQVAEFGQRQLPADWDYRHLLLPGQADLLSVVGQYFDVNSLELSHSDLQSVHVLLSQQFVRPFLSVAREELPTQIERFGIGGGVQWMISRQTSIGAEVLYFAPTTTPELETLRSDLRVVGRFEVRF